MTELANLQRWLTSIIIKPGALNDKIRLADDTYKVNNASVIRSSVSMSSGQKIGIYARGYVLRLMECMSAEFASVQYLFGDELFDTFAKAYLVHVPPTSPDLYDLGRNFPAFLKASQPKNGEDDLFDLPVELAELERAIAEASRIKGLEGIENDAAIDEQMLFLFGNTAYKASPCLILMRSQFALIDFVKAVFRGEEPETPKKQDGFIAISRKNFTVYTHQLEPWQWHFLKSLQSSNDYNETLRLTVQISAIAKDILMADLVLWLPVALNFGYIYRQE